jgi:hypothetical protein
MSEVNEIAVKVLFFSFSDLTIVKFGGKIKIMRKFAKCFILCLLILITIAALSCKKQSSESSKSSLTQEIREISIMGPGVWHLSILPDGTGYISWAASSHPNSIAAFPKGTLDFYNILTTLELNLSSGGEKTVSLSVAIFRVGEYSTNSQEIPEDSEWAKALFTKAYESANKTGTWIEKFWKEHPPFQL